MIHRRVRLVVSCPTLGGWPGDRGRAEHRGADFTLPGSSGHDPGGPAPVAWTRVMRLFGSPSRRRHHPDRTRARKERVCPHHPEPRYFAGWCNLSPRTGWARRASRVGQRAWTSSRRRSSERSSGPLLADLLARRRRKTTRPAGQRCDLRFWWWPGAGSNRRPSDFQSDARTN